MTKWACQINMIVASIMLLPWKPRTQIYLHAVLQVQPFSWDAKQRSNFCDEKASRKTWLIGWLLHQLDCRLTSSTVLINERRLLFPSKKTHRGRESSEISQNRVKSVPKSQNGVKSKSKVIRKSNVKSQIGLHTWRAILTSLLSQEKSF
jgi:hypothetical protein